MKSLLRTNPFLPILAATAALSAQAAAVAPAPQFSTAQGPLSNWSVGVTTSAGVASGTQDQIQIRAPNVASSLPTNWTVRKFGQATLNHPNYSVSALQANWGNVTTPAGVQIFNATSTGGDVMPVVSAQGLVNMDTTQWFVVTFSLKPGANGLPGSFLASRYQALGSISAEVYSYFPEGAESLNAQFGDTVHVEATHSQLGLLTTATVHNLDYGTGVISTDPNNLAGQVAPIRDQFYFTLTPAWLVVNPVQWTYGTSSPTLVTPGDICRMTWNGTSWSPPVIAYRNSDLFPEGSPHASLRNINVEIDALSVYVAPATTTVAAQERILFSLARAAAGSLQNQADQFLIFQRGHSGPGLANQSVDCPATTLMTLVDGVAEPLSEAAGVRGPLFSDPDDVESTCATDPHGAEVPPMSTNDIVGLPLNGMIQGKGDLGLSVIRTRIPDPNSSATANSAPIVEFLNILVTDVQTSDTAFTLVAFQASASAPTTAPPASIFGPYGGYFEVAPSDSRGALSLSFQTPPGSNSPLQIMAEVYQIDFLTGLSNLKQQSWVITLEL